MAKTPRVVTVILLLGLARGTTWHLWLTPKSGTWTYQAWCPGGRVACIIAFWRAFFRSRPNTVIFIVYPVRESEHLVHKWYVLAPKSKRHTIYHSSSFLVYGVGDSNMSLTLEDIWHSPDLCCPRNFPAVAGPWTSTGFISNSLACLCLWHLRCRMFPAQSPVGIMASIECICIVFSVLSKLLWSLWTLQFAGEWKNPFYVNANWVSFTTLRGMEEKHLLVQ